MSKIILGIVFLCFFLVNLTCAGKKGVLVLDELNFDKIVDGSDNVLVQIVEYTWKATDYEKVAEEFKDNKDVIIALIEYSDNKEFLKQRFGIQSAEELPSIKFYPSGKTTPDEVTGDDSSSLIEYITFSINAKLSKLKKLAKEFSESTKKDAILKKTKEFVTKELPDNTWGKYYVSSMQKINEKGKDFITKEKERLNGLINNKSSTKEKVTEFKKRLTVLDAFNSETKKVQS